MQQKTMKPSSHMKFYEVQNIEEKKQVELMLVQMKKQIAIIMPDEEMYVHLGMVELLVGQPENALKAAKQAIRCNESSYLGWYVLGCAYLDLRELANAKSAYEEAIHQRPPDMPKEIDHVIIEDVFDSLQIIEILTIKKNKGR